MNDAIVPLFQGELFFAGWSDSHTQGPKITFSIQDQDLDVFRDMTVKKGKIAGQRLMAVFVEINDDEKPIMPSVSQRCAMMCKSRQFQQFVEKVDGYSHEYPAGQEEQARKFVLRKCSIISRAELDSNSGAAIIWGQILRDFHDYSK